MAWKFKSSHSHNGLETLTAAMAWKFRNKLNNHNGLEWNEALNAQS